MISMAYVERAVLNQKLERCLERQTSSCVPPSGRALGAWRPEPLSRSLVLSSRARASPPIRVTILTRGGASAAHGELRPGALGPASRLRRRYADAPAGAPSCAPSASSGGSTALPARSEARAVSSFLTSKRSCRIPVFSDRRDDRRETKALRGRGWRLSP
jgi:hypothetical protein